MVQTKTKLKTFEKSQSYAKSKIWKLQTEYYKRAGIEAWRKDELPLYITSNPVMGQTYAEIVFGLLKDLARQGKKKEKVYLLELGAGHGQFCFHFLKYLEKLLFFKNEDLPPFCYLLSDIAIGNIEFMESHPRLKPFIERGWLDFAIVDANHISEIYLRESQIELIPGTLNQPLVVVGNYFFDSLAHELYYIENKKLFQTLVTINIPEGIDTNDPVAVFENFKLEYENRELKELPYREAYLNQVLKDYVERYDEVYLPFAEAGLRCLHQLRQFSSGGLLLLSADKGHHNAEAPLDKIPPIIVTHKSFSLSVNYHTYKQYCNLAGGRAMFPRYLHFNLCVACLLFANEPEKFVETTLGHEQAVNEFNPDDFFLIKRFVEKHQKKLSCEDVIGFLRLSGYDADLFIELLPRIRKLIKKLTGEEQWSLFQMMQRIWDHYYQIEEDQNLAFYIGALLYKMKYYQPAIIYFNHAMSNGSQSKKVLKYLAKSKKALTKVKKA